MKKEYIINLNNLNNLRQFNGDIIYGIESDVNAMDSVYRTQIIDAKSMMGLMMISAHDIIVSINSSDEKELETFRKICEKYEVKNG